jgi:hypothetical protein
MVVPRGTSEKMKKNLRRGAKNWSLFLKEYSNRRTFNPSRRNDG